MSIFGDVNIASQLEQAVIDTLQKWFATYLTEYELQAGLIPNNTTPLKHPLPKSYYSADQLDKPDADMLPCIVVVNPGMSTKTPPKQEGDGTFRVFFNVGIGCFVGTTTRAETLKLVRVYTAICRMIMLQKQSLGGFADGVTWLDESYDDNFPFVDKQTIGAGQVVFEVEISGFMDRFAGPKTVDPSPTQPGSNWPLAAQVLADVDVEGEDD